MTRQLRSGQARLESGIRLHYADCGPMDGEPVVFAHGWPDSSFSFSRVLPLLPDTFRAVVFDQRGFGDSDKPESGYTIPEMAHDLVALLDALAIPSATIVGHSFGSFVARRTAIAYPEQVSGLVLIGTGFTPANDVTRDVADAMRDLPDPISQEFAREFQASTVHHPVPPEFFDRIVVESMKLPTRLWRATFDGLLEYDDARQLAAIKPRTLLLWGDHDALFSRLDQQRFQEMVPSAQLKIYEDTGHCPNWERPEQVAADIAAFMRQG